MLNIMGTKIFTILHWIFLFIWTLHLFQVQDKLEDQPEVPTEFRANRVVGDLIEALEDEMRTNPDAQELDKILFDPNVRVSSQSDPFWCWFRFPSLGQIKNLVCFG